MDRPRQVRCASCKTAWTASASDDASQEPAAPTLLGEETPAYRPETVEAAAPPAADETAEPVQRRANPLAKLIRDKTKAKAQTRKAVAAGVVWGGLAAAMILVVASAALFRVEVVRLVPSTAGAYAKVGLTVNPVGLAPEGVEAGPGLSNGHAAVIVTGKLRNVQDRAHPPAPLRIILMDKGGHHLADRVLPAGDHPLQPGEARPFQLAFIDPPSGVAQVQVEFAFDAMTTAHTQPAKAKHEAKAHAAPAAHHEELAVEAEPHGAAAEFKLRGPAHPSHPGPIPAKVAEPLSEDSPYALPAAARTHAGHG